MKSFTSTIPAGLWARAGAAGGAAAEVGTAAGAAAVERHAAALQGIIRALNFGDAGLGLIPDFIPPDATRILTADACSAASVAAASAPGAGVADD